MAKTERKTIKVISIGSWRPAGKAEVLEFAGEDRITYETWSKELAEHIKVDTTIEADVEFTENVSQGKTYFHNKIIQIYVDGQPVKSKSHGYMSHQDSPEKIASIESQKRADLICQLWIAGKIVDNDPLVVKVRAWLSLLGITPVPTAASPAAAKPAPSASPAPAQQPPATGQFANAGEFLMACSKNLMLTKTQVLKKLGIDSLEKVNFQDAYQLLKESK